MAGLQAVAAAKARALAHAACGTMTGASAADDVAYSLDSIAGPNDALRSQTRWKALAEPSTAPTSVAGAAGASAKAKTSAGASTKGAKNLGGPHRHRPRRRDAPRT